MTGMRVCIRVPACSLLVQEMKRIRKCSLLALLAVIAGCGNIDGPTHGNFIGTWRVVSIDNEALPTVLVTGHGLVHTEYAFLTLNIPAEGSASFSEEVADLSAVDNSEIVRFACTGPVTYTSKADTLILHPSTLTIAQCPSAIVEGERFVRSGDQLLYKWNGHVARLKQ